MHITNKGLLALKVNFMKIVIASDHAGLNLKTLVYNYLKQQERNVVDLGTDKIMPKTDYPLYAARAAAAVAAKEYDFGILVCGTGIGMAMAANRVHGARAANCVNEYMARLSRAHNNANILTLGERVLGSDLTYAIVTEFLNTPFEGGRHQARIDLF